jgi:transcriptional regulator with XRE-family HTH domain
VEPFALTRWLGQVLKQARESAELSTLDLYSRAGVQPSTQSRFERGEQGVRDVDAVVSAYAHATGTKPADLWREALELCELDPKGRKLDAAARGRAAVKQKREAKRRRPAAP